MMSCVVCNVFISDGRCKDLRECKRGKDLKDSFMDFVQNLVSSSGAKSKNGIKLTSVHACLPCFRELNSTSELEMIFHSKRSELLRKIKENQSQNSKNARKKLQGNNENTKTLNVTRELFIAPVRPATISIHTAINEKSGGLPLESILSMDAEITITTKENGEAEIDFEVVEGTFDLKRDNGKYGCRFCKREFVSSEYAINHMREVHGRLLHKCETCGLEFRLKSEIDDHKVSHLKDGPMPYQCGTCPRGFQNFEAFQEHNKLHHLKKRFGCGQCGRKYDDENKLNQHMASHQIKPFSCPKCNKLFRSSHACLRHQRLHGDSSKYNCNLCLKQFTSAEILHTHLKNHNRPFRCDLCNKGFDSQETLEKHNENHGKQKRNVECKTCGKRFITILQLESHVRVHTGEKPFQCDACGATFSQRSNLDSHHRAVHLQERRFRCTICDKSFKRRRLLQYHIRSVHTGERPYVCETCNSSFVYPEHYKKHLLTHSGIKPWPCEICGKTFSSKDNRNAHRFTHSDRKPYECQSCGMSFMRKPALLDHLKLQGHGDPETAGAAVKIVQVLHDTQDPDEWLQVQNTQSLPLEFATQEMIQTLVIPDAIGRKIEICVLNPEDLAMASHTVDTVDTVAADQLQFELNDSLTVMQAFEMQSGNVDDTLAALM